MGTLVFCRHGNTFEAHETPVWVGARTDLPLTAEGEAQAQRAARYLGAQAWRFDFLTAGPLRRTRRFAEILGEALGLATEIDARLCEIDYGLWEGLSGAEIVAQYGDADLLAWEKDGVWPVSMKWEPSLPVLQANIEAFLETQYAALSVSAARKHCAVTSNGILRILYRMLHQKAGLVPDLEKAKVKTGHLCVLETTPQGWAIVSWNEKP